MTDNSEQTSPPLVQRILRGLWRIVQAFGNYCKLAAAFYWSNRRHIKKFIAEYLGEMPDAKSSRREITFTEYDDGVQVSRDGKEWKIGLPDCCFICGEETDQSWGEESQSVERFGIPVALPLVGFVTGLIAWLWADSYSLLVLLIAGGFLLGYALRRQVRVTMVCRRCADHEQTKKSPRARVRGESIIVRVGSAKVRRRANEHGDRKTPAAAKDTAPPTSDSEQEHRIPLADHSGTEIIHDHQTPRLDELNKIAADTSESSAAEPVSVKREAAHIPNESPSSSFLPPTPHELCTSCGKPLITNTKDCTYCGAERDTPPVEQTELSSWSAICRTFIEAETLRVAGVQAIWTALALYVLLINGMVLAFLASTVLGVTIVLPAALTGASVEILAGTSRFVASVSMALVVLFAIAVFILWIDKMLERYFRACAEAAGARVRAPWQVFGHFRWGVMIGLQRLLLIALPILIVDRFIYAVLDSVGELPSKGNIGPLTVLAFAGLCFLAVFLDAALTMQFGTVAIGGSLSPIRTLRWIWRCGVDYVAYVFSVLLMSTVHVLAFVLLTVGLLVVLPSALGGDAAIQPSLVRSVVILIVCTTAFSFVQAHYDAARFRMLGKVIMRRWDRLKGDVVTPRA